MEHNRREVVAWVASHVLPHEADVRLWLKRMSLPADQIDDVIHDAYCQIAGLKSVAHIENGRAYFFQAARSVILQKLRRARVVRIDTMTEMESLGIVCDEPTPERATSARRELDRVLKLIDQLPESCRHVFRLRRIQGLSQRETAAKLGVSENVVENQSIRGLKLILEALAKGDAKIAVNAEEDRVRRHVPTRFRQRH